MFGGSPIHVPGTPRPIRRAADERSGPAPASMRSVPPDERHGRRGPGLLGLPRVEGDGMTRPSIPEPEHPRLTHFSGRRVMSRTTPVSAVPTRVPCATQLAQPGSGSSRRPACLPRGSRSRWGRFTDPFTGTDTGLRVSAPPPSPRSCPPLAVAFVSRLAKLPASAGLALTRRTQPRISSSEGTGDRQLGRSVACHPRCPAGTLIGYLPTGDRS